jgi:hypothetical protein
LAAILQGERDALMPVRDLEACEQLSHELGVAIKRERELSVPRLHASQTI